MCDRTKNDRLIDNEKLTIKNNLAQISDDKF